MFLIAIILLLICIGLPAAYALRVSRLDEPSLAAWSLVTLEAVLLVALVLLLGRWDIAGIYLRPALGALLVAAVIWSFRKHASRPWWPHSLTSLWHRYWHSIVSLAFFASTLVYIASGLIPEATPQPLAFPLQHERAFVGQGGGIILLNHHANHPEQRFALDFTALNAVGFRAAGLLPPRLDRYEIWNVAVVSPCDGVVAEIQSELPDLVPPASDSSNPAGNHVVLDCGAFRVELAHLKHDTLVVTKGQHVKAGNPVGRVGNSGNTTEPHLHIHAYNEDSRLALPITFDGRTPSRNRVFTNLPRQ